MHMVYVLHGGQVQFLRQENPDGRQRRRRIQMH